MTEIMRSRVALSGWVGGPGVCTYYWSGGTLGSSLGQESLHAFHQELGAVFTAAQGMIPNGITWEVSPDVDVIDVPTGNIVGQLTDEASPIKGTATASGGQNIYSTMLCVGFYTDRFINGRRLKGRTFIGPLHSIAINSVGEVQPTLSDAVLDAFIAPTSGLGPRLAVYHRPTFKGGADGAYGDVRAVRAMKMAAVLRSRRD